MFYMDIITYCYHCTSCKNSENFVTALLRPTCSREKTATKINQCRFWPQQLFRIDAFNDHKLSRQKM